MDFHRRQGVLRWILRKIEEEIPEPNKSLIYGFDHDNLVRGLSLSTRTVYLSHLYKFSGQILDNQPFDQASKFDIARILEYIESNGYTNHTKENVKRSLKTFFRHIGRGELIENVRMAPKSEVLKNCIPEVILEKKEIKALINAEKSDLVKTLISLMGETGCRIGEITSLRTQSVTFDKIGAKLTVNGKTGKRVVRIVRCKCNNPNLAVNLLSRIIDYDKEYIFSIRNQLTGRFEPMKYRYVQWVFERLRKSKIINKHLHCHLFRHTRATQLSAWLSYTQLCDHFGWKYGSKMPSIYIRANNVALDNAFLRGYGMEEVNPEKLCLWC